MKVEMSKSRVKQQNVSVIGLFSLAGRHEKMDDVFVYHECQSTRWSHSTKNKNKQTQSKQRLPRAFYHVCSFFHMPLTAWKLKFGGRFGTFYI